MKLSNLGENMSFYKGFKTIIFITCFSLTGCIQGMDQLSFDSNPKKINVNDKTNGVVALKEVFDSSVEKIPTLTAVGYAVVSSQPGRSEAQKRLRRDFGE